MKAKEWATPNRMKIKTGHTTFDRQTNAIRTGNAIGNTQHGQYIRAYMDTKTWAGAREPGALQGYDLDHFRYLRRYGQIRRQVEEITRERSAILYCFFHYRKGQAVIHGFILTDDQHRLVREWVVGPTYKSYNIIHECALYVSS